LGDVAEDRVDALVLEEAVGHELEHVGGVVEWARHLEVEPLQGGDGGGLWCGIADVPEGLESAGVLHKVAGR
jgi:hypothetical protein